MSRLSDQRGFTLVELLVTMAIGVAMFGGLLGALEVMLRQSAMSRAQSEAQDVARSTMDVLAVSLRNAIALTGTTPSAVQRHGDYDLIFQSVNAMAPPTSTNRYGAMRIRYCLDRTVPSRPVLRKQTQPDATATAQPTATACNATLNGWATNQVVAADLVDDGAVFRYAYDESGLTGAANVRSLAITLAVDTDPSDARGKRALTGGVTIRNANRSPVAMISITRSGPYTVSNGAGSYDPDGDSLTYRWFVDGVEQAGESGVRLRRTGLATGAVVTLQVTDAGGLPNSTAKAVPAP